MKRFLKIFVPILLSLAIIFSIGWYFFSYDTELTKDILLSCAKYFDSKDNTSFATWFYDRAYEQSANPDAIAIEFANNYMEKGDFTKAEVTLNKAIAEGAGAEVYVTLCRVYVKQDKVLDAIYLLNNISDPTLKAQLDEMRPAPPIASFPAGDYDTYISVSFESNGNALYVNSKGNYPSITADSYQSPINTTPGINELYAVAIAPNGLVSTLATYKYTIIDVVEKVVFQDAVMEKAVRTLLRLSDSYEIMTNDLWKIKSFTIPKDAKIYSDLKYMKTLETLNLDHGVSDQLSSIANLNALTTLNITNTLLSFSDVETVGNVTSLESLTLDSCGLSTISPLSQLTSLHYLNLANNSLRDLSAISSMTELKELNLHRNALNDLSALSQCQKLQILDISSNPSILSIDPLSALTEITRLDITDNKLANMDAASQMTQLQELKASNNTLTNIEPLQNCLELSFLDISHNAITDLSPLNSLVKITSLDFSDNQVTALPSWPVTCLLVSINGTANLISDLSPLSGLQNLNFIFMDNNPNIQYISMLVSCPNLVEIYVQHTMVKEEDVKLIPEDMGIIIHYDYIPN